MYRSIRLLFALTAVLGLGFALASPANAVFLKGSQNDSDNDGYANAIETHMGSNPSDGASTPESMVIRPIKPLNGQFTNQLPDACRDGVDNDLDGQTDEGNDTGCNPPGTANSAFPNAAGETPVAVRLVTKGLLVNAGTVGLCASDFDGIGFAVIKNDPADGTNPDHMNVEVVALQVQGTSEIIDDNPAYPDNPAAGNQSGPTPPWEPTECGLTERGEHPPPADAGFKSAVDVIQDPAAGFQSFGSFDDNNPGDALLDFPATSSITAKTLTYPSALGFTVKASGAPLVHSNVTQIAPYCTANCNVKSTDDPFGSGADCYVGTDAKGALCIIEPEGPLTLPATDNMRLYKTTGPKITKAEVHVKSEFEAVPILRAIGTQTTLGVPTDKDSTGILNGDANLRCYKEKYVSPYKFSKTAVSSADEYGIQRLDIKKQAELCMSAQVSPNAAPTGQNNYECYSVTTKAKLGTSTVTLDDRFGPATTGVKVTLKPKLWCAPADVNGGGIADSSAYLTCYKTSGGTPGIPPQVGLNVDPVGTPDPPFATETLNAVKGQLLCTPSTRTA